MKIVTIVGARPQFIKAAVVSRAFNLRRDQVREVIVHTGQHFDANMSDLFFHELDIPKPAYHLGIGGGTHGQNTGRMLEAVETVLMNEKPDWALVYGDTDSTLAGALAAVKIHVPVAHVEAGLRSFNLRMPEEVNRVATDHLCTRAFTPTTTATRNLISEGVPKKRISQAGDVMYDAALYYARKAEQQSSILRKLEIEPNSYGLATVHRQENTDSRDNLNAILAGLAASPVPIILPLHPRTRKRLADFGLSVPKTVRIVEPVGYLDMTILEKHARLIVTDSGGVQKEAYFHHVPCITLREETEWTETVEAGGNVLVGPNAELIANYLSAKHTQKNFVQGLFGDGASGEKIAAELLTDMGR